MFACPEHTWPWSYLYTADILHIALPANPSDSLKWRADTLKQKEQERRGPQERQPPPPFGEGGERPRENLLLMFFNQKFLSGPKHPILFVGNGRPDTLKLSAV